MSALRIIDEPEHTAWGVLPHSTPGAILLKLDPAFPDAEVEALAELFPADELAMWVSTFVRVDEAGWDVWEYRRT